MVFTVINRGETPVNNMPVLPGMKPDRAPDYTNVYNADYGCASGGIEWGPYVPESL